MFSLCKDRRTITQSCTLFGEHLSYSDYEKSKKRRETEITENVSLKQSKEISENRISTTKKKRSYKEEMEYNADKIEQLEAEIEK